MPGTLIQIKEDGLTHFIPWTKKGPPDYTCIRNAIRGYFERTRVRWDGKLRDMYVRENGYAEGCQPNAVATRLYTRETGSQHVIVGPVAIWVPGEQFTGPPDGFMLSRVSAATREVHCLPVEGAEYNYHKWKTGELSIAKAFPDLDMATREYLISGTTKEEWGELFEGEE